MDPMAPVKTLKGFACPYCGWVTERHDSIRQHIPKCMSASKNKKAADLTSEKLTHYCRFCRQNFKSDPELLAHKSSTHPQCGVCGTALSSNTYVGRHYMQHEKMITKPCFWCKKKHDTLVEVAIHCHEEHLPCELCGARLSSEYTRTTHFNMKHGGQQKTGCSFPCTTCNTSYDSIVDCVAHFSEKHSTRFNQRQRARPHSMVYTRNYSSVDSMDADGWAPVPVDGGFACPRCGWVSCTDYVVKAHYNKVHSADKITEKRTQCNICKDEFPTMDVYFEHRKKHPICPVCRQVMIDGAVLHKHLDEKHPVCVICGKLLDNFLKMNMHSASHAEANCHRCNKKFPTMIALRTHYSADHKEKKCYLCETYHSDKAALFKHLEKDHYYNVAAHADDKNKGPKRSHNYMKPQSTQPTPMGFYNENYDESLYINFPLDGSSELQELDGSDDAIANLIKATPGEPKSKKLKYDASYADEINAAVSAAMGGNVTMYVGSGVKDEDDGEASYKNNNSGGSPRIQSIRQISEERFNSLEQEKASKAVEKAKAIQNKGSAMTHKASPAAHSFKSVPLSAVLSEEEDQGEGTACSMCGITFLRPGILKAHMKMVHGASTSGDGESSSTLPPALPPPVDTKVKCKYCSKIIPSGLQYNEHISSHPSCEVCSRRFRNETELSRHRVITHPLCYVCGSLLESVMMVSEHYATHEEARCFLCSDAFDNMQKLMAHYEQEHGPCTVCGDSFATKESLDQHEMDHKK